MLLLSKLEARVLQERLVWACLAPHQETATDAPDLDDAVAEFDAALEADPVASEEDPDRLALLRALRLR